MESNEESKLNEAKQDEAGGPSTAKSTERPLLDSQRFSDSKPKTKLASMLGKAFVKREVNSNSNDPSPTGQKK